MYKSSKLASGNKRSSRFKPGGLPWNKGMKGCYPHAPYIRTAEIRLKNSKSNRGISRPWTAEFNRRTKTGITLSSLHKEKIGKTTRRLRRTLCPIWNKGLTKETDMRVARTAEKLSLRTKGVPKPFVSDYQGVRRRFWYYGPTRRLRMRSRWEVVYAHYLDRAHIPWVYEAVVYVLKHYSYTPDFVLLHNQVHIEIKGFFRQYDIDKLNAFRKHYPRIKLHVLRMADLQKRGLLDVHGGVLPVERRKHGK